MVGAARAGTEDRVIVRFLDNELVEGTAVNLDLDHPAFELRCQPTTNNTAALIALPAVKCVTLERRSLGGRSAKARLQKVALHFQDGEVLTGLIGKPPARRNHGLLLTLVSPRRDEAETLAVPYMGLKAIFYLKTWDSRIPEFTTASGHWSWQSRETPLVDLLGEVERLRRLKTRGHLDEIEFQRRRRQVLERI